MTRPHKPAGPVAKRSRHTIAAATGERALKHDARGEALLLERDAQRVLAWLAEAPLRTITSEGLRQWMAAQDPAWTHGYCTAVKARVQEALTEHTAAGVPEVRARMLHLMDGLIPECREIVLGGGDMLHDRRAPEWHRFNELHEADDAWRAYDQAAREWLKERRIASRNGYEVGPKPEQPRRPRLTDSDWAEMHEIQKRIPFLTAINHAAVQGYLKLAGQLTGALTEEHRHLHVHAKPEDLSDDELRARIAKSTTAEVRDG